MYTPDIISNLQSNEVFVFGTNQFGEHAGGAAVIAKNKFGAINGIPIGLCGQTYGIITTSFNDVKIDLDTIANQVVVLYYFAQLRPDLKFFVTKIGTGIAGFSTDDIHGVFINLEHSRPDNIILPKEFHA